MSASGRPSLRPIGFVGLAWGTVLLTVGRPVFAAVQGRDPSDGERVAIVALGLRHGGQGLLQILIPDRFGHLYAGIDVLHAASMYAVAAKSSGRRRAALLSAGVATAAAILSVRAA